MRVGIDARFLTHPQLGGFKTYTENLVAALAEVDRDNEYILYLDREPDSRTRLPDAPNFRPSVVPGRLPMVGMPWREQVGLRRRVSSDRIDVWHGLCLTAPLWPGCPVVLTIHDMMWRRPRRYRGSSRLSAWRLLLVAYYRVVPDVAGRGASVIITVSEASKQRIVEHFQVAPDRVVVTHEAAAPAFVRVADRRAVDAACLRRGLMPGFAMVIGSSDPRKNLSTVVRAFAALPGEVRARTPLVIVWTSHALEPELRRLVDAVHLSSQVRFLDGVSTEELVVLYNAASLFLFPSLEEGFGLPILEAMACGTPVLAANNSSMPEVVGDAGLLVDATDATSMSARILQGLTDDRLRADLVEKGLRRAAAFSWERCARGTLRAYATAASTRGGG